MCFNQPFTGAMAALNLGTGLYLARKGHRLASTQICYVFFLMELLQFIQYSVAGDCGSWVNQLTTIVRTPQEEGGALASSRQASRRRGAASRAPLPSACARRGWPSRRPSFMTAPPPTASPLPPALLHPHLLPAIVGQHVCLPARAQPRYRPPRAPHVHPRRRPRRAAPAPRVARRLEAPPRAGMGLAARAARPPARRQPRDLRHRADLRAPCMCDARGDAHRVGAAPHGGPAPRGAPPPADRAQTRRACMSCEAGGARA
jgi:hypothetical protein